MMMRKPKNYEIHYEATGRFKTPKMLYRLSVTQTFSDLGNARHCAKMLKRGGCFDVAVNMVKTTPAKKAYTEMRVS